MPKTGGTKTKSRKKNKRMRITKGWRRRSRMTFSPFSWPSKEFLDTIKNDNIDFILLGKKR